MAGLVTLFGGGGFIGRYAAQTLLRRGARVRIVGRVPRQAYFVKPLGGLGQTQFVAADVRKPDTVARAVAGADAVINLVGTLDGDFQRLNVDGARTVAEAASAAGALSLVHISAIGADPASPSAYGRSKGEGEQAVRAAFAGATILRPSIVFGAEDHFVNRFARMMRAPVVPIVAPKTRFEPVFVGDVGKAIAAAALDPRSFGGRSFELGGPEVMSMTALIHAIAEMTGRRPAFLDLPDSLASLIAGFGFLPGAPLTRDQWRMLQRDNVAAEGCAGLAALGVTPTPLSAAAPSWLVRYRRNGRFGAEGKAS